MARENIYALGDVAHVVADALERAVDEHGTPNSFSPGELAAFYLGGAYVRPATMGAGFVIAAVGRILRRRGFVIEYRDRRYHVARGAAQ